jgi:AraC family transcriptional regulator
MLTQWEKIQAVQRMQDYIERHLCDPITMADLARAAHYSQWHAARLFREVADKSPFEYIRLRRLSQAARELEEGSARIIDVALDFVFDSHAGFTRAFARQFGVTPSEFRKGGTRAQVFMPPHLSDWYRRRQQGENVMPDKKPQDTVFVQVLDRPQRRLIVKRGRQATHYFEYCEEVGCEVWDQLSAIADTIHEPMGLWLPEGMIAPGTSPYVQGVEVACDYTGAIPDGYDIIELPPCKMMVFQGPPFDDKDFEKAIASLWDAINAYQPEVYGYRWADELAPRFQLIPEGYRGYIEGRPVTAI